MIYRVSELGRGLEHEAKYFQFRESAIEFFEKKLTDLKRIMPLVDKKDLNGEEPVKIQEFRPYQEDFVRSATLKYWESFDTETDYSAVYEIAQMVLCITKHELIGE